MPVYKGCLKPPEDLSGQKFGRRTALRRVGSSRRRSILWEYRCDCGAVGVADTTALRRRQSCGCLQREATARGRHGHCTRAVKQPEYYSWRCMKNRCDSPTATGYKHYGGRGIAYCERWGIYENFYADMGARPPGTTLDRIDNDGNYEPGNCRWATRAEQSASQRRRTA